MLVTVVVPCHQGGTVGCLPPLQACMTPSGTLRASSQEGGFQINSSSGAWVLCLKCNGVFNNRELAFYF